MNKNKLTDIGRRMVAYAVDVLLIFVIFLLTQTFILAPVRNLLGSKWLTSGLQLELYVLATISVPTWCYFAISEYSSWQATVGKRLLGLKVSDLAGHRIGFYQALLRTVIKLLPWELAHLIANLPYSMWINPDSGAVNFNQQVSTVRLGLFSIVYLLMAFFFLTMILNSRAQSIHALIAGTLVSRK